jgi:hypothetical protein
MDDLETACGCGHPECQAMLSAWSDRAEDRIEYQEGRK